MRSAAKNFSWHVTQPDLADATGLSIVHVNRSLQLLRERRLIEAAPDKVTILDWPGLKSLADFKADYLAFAPHIVQRPDAQRA